MTSESVKNLIVFWVLSVKKTIRPFILQKERIIVMGITYGYARCSTNETLQDIDRQKRELRKLGVETDERIYCEYESGTKLNRPELNKLLDIVTQGDTIVTTEVSRLTRSTSQAMNDTLTVLQEERRQRLLAELHTTTEYPLQCSHLDLTMPSEKLLAQSDEMLSATIYALSPIQVSIVLSYFPALVRQRILSLLSIPLSVLDNLVIIHPMK